MTDDSQKAASKPIPAAVNSDRAAGYDALRNPLPDATTQPCTHHAAGCRRRRCVRAEVEGARNPKPPGKIVWDDTKDDGTAPDGTRYALFSEGARDEGRVWQVAIWRDGWRFIEADSYSWPTKRYVKALAQRHYDGRLRRCP